MSIKNKKVGFVCTIVSIAISVVTLLTTADIDNKVEAIVVPGNPNDYLVNPGTGYDGVAQVNIDISVRVARCSGSLLRTGLHILTAAHCLTSTSDSEELLPGIPRGTLIARSAKVFFDLPTGRTPVDASEFYIHPDWKGEYYNGNDLAVIKLAAEAPAAAERYDIYRGNDELSQVHTKVGYGVTGNGNTGFVIDQNLKKRAGQNTYDAFAERLNGAFPGFNFSQGTALLYDFDNGKPANDALGVIPGIPNLGLGANEVLPAPGDSGGPVFINKLIAGIISDGIRQPLTSDIDNIPYNSSFGEMGFDTRVSFYSNYIDNVLAGKIEPSYKIPEPSLTWGTVLFLATFVINSRFKKK